jgi:hypothetical protein
MSVSRSAIATSKIRSLSALDVSYETVRRWGLKFQIQRAIINAAIVSASADAAPT